MVHTSPVVYFEMDNKLSCEPAWIVCVHAKKWGGAGPDVFQLN